MKKEWIEPEIETLEFENTEALNVNPNGFSPVFSLLSAGWS